MAAGACVALHASCATGCAEPAPILSAATTTETGVGTVDWPTTGDSSGTAGSASGTDDGDSSGGPPTACGDPDSTCSNKIDLLFVIDNSGTMGEEQLTLAENFPLLIAELEDLTDLSGDPVGADVNVMVTTTDFDNPLCHGSWTHRDYVPAKGSPISTPCTERLGRFTGYGEMPLVIEEACLDVCDPKAPAAPTDQFIHFDAAGNSNVVGGSPADALACIGPQGIDGCGYEAPLESMSQALNPGACWNDPEACDDPQWDWITQPFLRDDAVLAIAIITDEADCSIKDFTILDDEAFMEVDPEVGGPMPSSAICWNAGVVCSDLDPESGQYGGCAAVNKGAGGELGVGDKAAVLQPLSRYTNLLAALGAQREVIMLGVLGVPEVTEHAALPPHHPTEGGLDALVYRNWRDPDVPGGGDILPDEWNTGVMAQDKQFEFGIGPGCTGYDPRSDSYTGQAVPPVRIREVCESLNGPDDPATKGIDETRIRCCVESICDDDFSPAIRCLTGLIRQAVVPVE